MSIGVRVQKEFVGNRVVPRPDTWVYDGSTFQCCTHVGSERLREGKQRVDGVPETSFMCRVKLSVTKTGVSSGWTVEPRTKHVRKEGVSRCLEDHTTVSGFRS